VISSLPTLPQAVMDYLSWLPLVFGIANVIVLLWSLIAAFWSISRTMNEARTLWDESERALHRLNKLISAVESERKRNDE
jgi:hypothetical protein